MERAAADVTRSGDVNPVFTPGAVVDLTGQTIFIGNISSGVGTTGTVNVTAGGILTAGQIRTGNSGLGTGFFNITGAGSVFHLAGADAPNVGFIVGQWGTGIVTVENGGLIDCASGLACFGLIGNAAGSTGSLAINGGSATGLGGVTVGLGQIGPGFGTVGGNTSATLSITNGGTLSSHGGSSVAANIGQTGVVTGNVTIDGAGSKWAIGRDFASGGQANLNLAPNSNGVAHVTLSNGGSLSITGARSSPATDNSLPALQMSGAAGATSTLTVTSGASIGFGGDSGVLNVGGFGGSSATSAVGATATLNVTGGATVSGTGANGLLFSAVGQNGASGTINISGAGSQLVLAGVGGQNTQGLDGVGGLMFVGRDRGFGGGNGTVNITAGGALVVSDNGQAATGGVGVELGRFPGSSGTVTVSGPGSSIAVSSTGGGTATPFVNVGNGGDAQMTLSDGATVSVLGSGQRNFTVNNASSGSGVLTMTNGATIVASRFAVADNSGIGAATIDNSTVNLDGVIIFNGVAQGAGVRVGRGDGSNGLLIMQNGAVININNSVDGSNVLLGGTGSLAGGTGTLIMSGNSSINFTGSAASASLQVGSVQGTGFMTMTGASTVNVGASGAAIVGNTAGSDGTLTVGGGSSITANVFGIGGNSDTTAGGTGSVLVTDAGSALNANGANGIIAVGRNGIGSLAVKDGATINAIALGVGRAGGGFGTLTVDNASLNLSGQQTTGALVGANLSVGVLGGVGAATISNSVVAISNPGSSGATLNVGGTPVSPGGTGVLTVNNSQINVTAAPGQAVVRIGHDGNGIATFIGSTLTVGNPTGAAADGSLVIAGQPGSTGVLVLNGGTVVKTGFVGVGATSTGTLTGGTATLAINNSTLNTNTFALGANGLLTGNDGVINASGDVIIAGTISPGNSPGRVTINCNLITLPGSMLVLDILGSAAEFSVDHLRIGNDSTFDLSDLHVVFNFLGDTDPNAFAATGGFDMDNFLQSLNLETGEVTGLSTAFAAGQTWGDVLNPGNISAVSPVYDISDLHLAADGSVTVVAIPVPEPSTWAMLVLGLLMVGSMAQRRAVARRR